mgnify:CR=1 FL=1|jgi:hypothetical protein
MSQHLLKVFLEHQGDNPDQLFMALDCWGQAVYKALQSYEIDYKYVFAKDINPIFMEGGNNWSLLLPDEDLNQRAVYEVKTVDFKHCDPDIVIENIINQNQLVVVHTAFDLIPAYDKKEITVLDRTHYSIIVGYNDHYFYVMDNPFVFNKAENIVHPNFPNISMIAKTGMKEAFKKKCELKTIQIKPEALSGVNNLDNLLKRIVATFYSAKTEKNEEHVLFYGKQALVKLIKALDNSDSECDKNSFLNNHYNAHLLYSSRLILKWCLEDDRQYHYSPHYGDVCYNLDSSMGKWQIAKMVIAKNNMKSSSNFLRNLKENILAILETEEKLIESLSKLVDCK